MALNRRSISQSAQEVESSISGPAEPRVEPEPKISFDNVVSTGSTLLDLAISGGRMKEGGIPGGIFVELYGAEGSGKTALLAEICASAQARGGDKAFLDPEGRLDQEYSRIYGMSLEEKNYEQPDTVEEIFDFVSSWDPKPTTPGAINFLGTDSLAALSTDLEMEKGDKMGMRRAKEFSEGLRKNARIIKKKNILMACSNQVRDGDYGETTPGGRAIRFYASLRIRLKQLEIIEEKARLKFGEEGEEESTAEEAPISRREKLKKEKAKNKREISKPIGIITECYVKKSSVDDPYRSCKIYIIFGYGIDDIRGNLAYIKEITNASMYVCPDGKSYQSLKQAVLHVESEHLEQALKSQTIELWNQIEEMFKTNRRRKERC